ncbi:hypothetical protein BS78_05G180500 [Paspalum vaginatum]|nr:hypothetical protein BS78_05G180500 [Paspalum vaginatum]
MTFSGRIPSHLGNLSNLQFLDLSYSTGATHLTNLSWITHLHFLRYLYLSAVNFSTVVDWPQAVNMIPSLRVLELSEWSLTSANQSLPHLNLTKHETLDLSFNYFNHPIASCWFWNITHLKQLFLESAGLYCPLPRALDGMTYLQVLHISEDVDGNPNKLCITMTSMRNLCNLETIYIRNLLCGDIAEFLDSLPQCSFSKLVEVDLEENYISGALPINWTWPVTSLESLDLFGNNIGGMLPNWMGQLTSLGYLDMAQNNIGGIIPASMSKLSSLGYLDLSQNNITGPLPSFVGNFTYLDYLDLSYNHLIGHVPHEIGMLSNLEYLNLENNDLDGNITEDHFSSLKSLQWIFLSSNSLKIEISSEWKPPFRLQGAYFTSCHMGPLFPSWLKWMVSINQLDISNEGINDRLPD